MDASQELENFHYVKAKMRDEGFHYCFKHYSSFIEIEDPKFHELRKAYLSAADELSNYVDRRLVELVELEEQSSDPLYSQIENAIIGWSIDGTKTAGSLTRDLIELINRNE